MLVKKEDPVEEYEIMALLKIITDQETLTKQILMQNDTDLHCNTCLESNFALRKNPNYPIPRKAEKLHE